MLMNTLKTFSKKGTLLIKIIKTKQKGLFSKYLLITNTVITVSSSCVGDLSQQWYERLRKRQSHWDVSRNKRITLTGLVTGPICHYWYVYLDRFLPGRTVSVIVKKVLVDQIVFSPVMITVFILMMGYLQSKSRTQMFDDLRVKGFDLFKAEWFIWPPASLVNFTFVPLQYRVLFDNVISFGFDYYYSYVMYRKDFGSNVEDKNDKLDAVLSKNYCCKIPEHSSYGKL